MAGISVQSLYARIRDAKQSADPPPFIKRGTRYLLPREAFVKWATQDVIE